MNRSIVCRKTLRTRWCLFRRLQFSEMIVDHRLVAQIFTSKRKSLQSEWSCQQGFLFWPLSIVIFCPLSQRTRSPSKALRIPGVQAYCRTHDDTLPFHYQRRTTTSTQWRERLIWRRKGFRSIDWLNGNVGNQNHHMGSSMITGAYFFLIPACCYASPSSFLKSAGVAKTKCSHRSAWL